MCIRDSLTFVTGIKGKIRLLRKEAFIKGENLSGMLEGVIFKITICDEGTIDFHEMDTKQSDTKMIQRFINDIDDREVTGYQGKYVVSGLEFLDEENKPCYLEVEYKKPIEQLYSIFEEKSPQNISQIGLSLLDSLFAGIDTTSNEEEVDQPESVVVTKRVSTESAQSQDYLQEQFAKMNQEKVAELKTRIQSTEKEVDMLKFDINRSEKKLEKVKEDLGILHSRLDTFNEKDKPNGFVFFVSDEQKPDDLGLSDDNRQVADKIAEIMGLKKDVLFKMLTQGYYKIQIAEKNDIESKEVKLTEEINAKLKSLTHFDKSDEAKITSISPGQYEFRGTLTWHQLVDRMIRFGFEQSPEFDKLCGSNSYDSDKTSNQESK